MDSATFFRADILQTCVEKHDIYGNTQVINNVFLWERGEAAWVKVAYILNMVDSRNLGFIECLNNLISSIPV